jgi:hypothetical protein
MSPKLKVTNEQAISNADMAKEERNTSPLRTFQMFHKTAVIVADWTAGNVSRRSP